MGPHREHRGVEVHALADTGRGWADKGVVHRSPAMEWRRFDPQLADVELTTEAVRQLRARHVSTRDAAVLLDVTPGRISQLARAAKL